MPALPQSITGDDMDMLADNILQWLGTPENPSARAADKYGPGDIAEAQAAPPGFNGATWHNLSAAYLGHLERALIAIVDADPAFYVDADLSEDQITSAAFMADFNARAHYVHPSQVEPARAFLADVRAFMSTDPEVSINAAISAPGGNTPANLNARAAIRAGKMAPLIQTE